jgi:hypothetical protein
VVFNSGIFEHLKRSPCARLKGLCENCYFHPNDLVFVDLNHRGPDHPIREVEMQVTKAHRGAAPERRLVFPGLAKQTVPGLEATAAAHPTTDGEVPKKS